MLTTQTILTMLLMLTITLTSACTVVYYTNDCNVTNVSNYTLTNGHIFNTSCKDNYCLFISNVTSIENLKGYYQWYCYNRTLSWEAKTYEAENISFGKC